MSRCLHIGAPPSEYHKNELEQGPDEVTSVWIRIPRSMRRAQRNNYSGSLNSFIYTTAATIMSYLTDRSLIEQTNEPMEQTRQIEQPTDGTTDWLTQLTRQSCRTTKVISSRTDLTTELNPLFIGLLCIWALHWVLKAPWCAMTLLVVKGDDTSFHAKAFH